MEKDEMIWAFMIQLGHNMWREKPLYGDKMQEGKEYIYAQDRNRVDVKMWNEVTEYAAKKGANTVLIDLGEGLAYPSHPELAVEGSWSPERMKEEIVRLRGLGLEPVPKLNFSACHDAWLKDYGRMVSTPEYYKVCADLIRDVCEIFGGPKLFHLGWDEERAGAQKSSRYIVSRQGDLWWHDMLFTAKEAERHGARPWIWSDKIWLDRREFCRRMPKSIMQSPWHYDRFWHFVRDDEEIKKRDWPEGVAGALAFKELADAGYDCIPCGSNLVKKWNMEAAVKFCKKHMGRGQAKGFLMASWMFTYRDKDLPAHLDGIDRLAEAKAAWYDNRHEEDLVFYGPVGKCVEASVAARRKEGREPVVITPDAKPEKSYTDDMPYLGFIIRDALVDVRWGETLAENGVSTENGVTTVRLAGGETIRCAEFRDLR